MVGRRTLLPWLLALGLTSAAAMADTATENGRQMYLNGLQADGSPLQGHQANGESVLGAQAACARCHRGSGLGGVEGKIAVPPITGKALFSEASGTTIVKQDIRYNPGLSEQHAPYTLASLANALRNGIHVSGRPLAAPMPRYLLTDAQVQALAAYLNTLSTHWSPGASADSLEIATVITPDVSPQQRRALTTTVRALLGQINANVGISQRQKISTTERQQHVRRKMLWSVWELRGPSNTWAQQLDDLQREKPVFALLSGTSNTQWEPMQNFCDRHQVVCWLPSLRTVPADAERSPYSLYFSAGVALEAQVIASKLRNTPGKVIQLVGRDPAAQTGAALLAAQLPATTSETLVHSDHTAGTLAQRLHQATAEDHLVLWLSPAELQQLPRDSNSPARVFISASSAGEDLSALPTGLRNATTLVQTQELAPIRSLNLQRFVSWAEGSKVDLLDPQLQSEAYFATRSLVYVLRSMLNNLYTEYFVEKAESALSMFESMQVQEEIQSSMMAPMMKRTPISAAHEIDQASMTADARRQQHLDDMRRRGGTTVYPRLSLGVGQRFASKGAYLMSVDSAGQALTENAEWVIP